MKSLNLRGSQRFDKAKALSPLFLSIILPQAA